MSDWLIVRIPFDQPDKPEIVEVLADVPINWKEFLEKKARQIKKNGRYIVANLLYDDEYYYPESRKEPYEKIEKQSE